jgi:hypothetical protein
MLDYKQLERIDKVSTLRYNDNSKLIFEWVKTGVISYRQYLELDAAKNAMLLFKEERLST